MEAGMKNLFKTDHTDAKKKDGWSGTWLVGFEFTGGE